MYLLRSLKDLSLESLSVPSYWSHPLSYHSSEDEEDGGPPGHYHHHHHASGQLSHRWELAGRSGSCSGSTISSAWNSGVFRPAVDMLPYEVLLHVMGQLRSSLPDLCSLALVCKRWNRIVCGENHLWEEHLVIITKEGEQPSNSEWDLTSHRQIAGGMRSLLVRKARERRALRERMAYLRSVHDGHMNTKLRCDPEQALHGPRPRPSMRLVVMGDRYVGKTSTIAASRAVNTLWAGSTTSVSVFGVSVNVEMWDLTESDRLRPSVYRHASAVLLLFNMIDRSTFTSLRDKHVPLLRNLCESSVPIILGGNFLDLLTCDPPSILVHDDNVVTLPEVKKLASEIGAVSYVPYSALSGCNLRILLEECASAVALGLRSSALKEGVESEEERGELAKGNRDKEKAHCILS